MQISSICVPLRVTGRQLRMVKKKKKKTDVSRTNCEPFETVWSQWLSHSAPGLFAELNIQQREAQNSTTNTKSQHTILLNSNQNPQIPREWHFPYSSPDSSSDQDNAKDRGWQNTRNPKQMRCIGAATCVPLKPWSSHHNPWLSL